MTAVLHSPALFLDRDARLGDRVRCDGGNSWLVLIGRVVDVADAQTGRMRIREEHSGDLVYVDRARVRVYAPALCGTCDKPLRSALATCLHCPAAEGDHEAWNVRLEDV